MIKVIYSKNGEPISDFKVYEAADRMIESHKSCKSIVVKTSSELYMMVFGLRVLEDKISADEVEFYFEDDKLEFSPYFGILEPMDKNLGFYSEVTDKGIKAGYEKMKRDRCINT